MKTIQKLIVGAAIAALSTFQLPAHAQTSASDYADDEAATLVSGPSSAAEPITVKKGGDGIVPAAAPPRVKLMTWYEHKNYNKGRPFWSPGRSADIYGYYGTCDYAGYTFRPGRDLLHPRDRHWWKTHLSSIKGYGQCNVVRLTNIAGTSKLSFYLPVSFHATVMNDNVGWVHVFSVPR